MKGRGLVVASAALSWILLVASPAFAVTATDVAVQAGIYEITRSWSAAPYDYDQDGDEDVFISRHTYKTPRLWSNNGNGTFSEVSQAWPIGDRHDCAWGDVNQDGRNDIYCTLGAVEGNGVGPNELWIQDEQGLFVNRAAQYGVTDSYGRGRATTFFDANGDVWPDLFVGNDYPRKDGKKSPNRLFISVNGTSFVEVKNGLQGEIGASCAQAIDYDKDGWDDLLVCGKGALKLYRNVNGSGFVNVAANVGISGAWHDAALVDMNNDGWHDLLIVRAAEFQVKLWDPIGGSFGATSFSSGPLLAGRALAAGDADGDGSLDVYVLQGTSRPDRMYMNDGTGTSFGSVPLPQAPSGSGDTVEAMDYDGDGRSDFIVLNGRDTTPGPVQLITFS